MTSPILGLGTADERIRWRMARRAPPLSESDIHLWRIDTAELTAAEPADIERLSTQERNRADRLVNERLRAEYIRVHARVRQILAMYLGLTPAEVTFSYSETGKPSLESNPDKIEFNLTTVTGLSLLAVARGQPLGIDCERVRPRDQLMGIARRMFPAADADALLELSDIEQLQAFYASWTALEAEVKVDGRGLGRRELTAPLAIEIRHFVPAAGLIGAVARHRVRGVEQWQTLVFAK